MDCSPSTISTRSQRRNPISHSRFCRFFAGVWGVENGLTKGALSQKPRDGTYSVLSLTRDMKSTKVMVINPSMSSLLSRITQTPGQCGGKPCIRGMRIRVADILEMLAENVSSTEILENFPDLELADIQACLIFAARRTDFPRLTA